MKPSNPFRLATASTLTAALLAACGGGGGDPVVAGAAAFNDRNAAAAQPPQNNARALAVVGPGQNVFPLAEPSRQITNAEFFAWAQTSFPSLFGTAPAQTISSIPGFDIRAYATGNYLGVSNGTIYALGPATANQLVTLGSVQALACTVAPSICQTPPGGGGGGNTAGNECIDPQSRNPPTGFRVNLVYSYTGPISGDQTVDSVVDGPATFEGQSATQVTSTTVGSNTVSAGGIVSTTTTTSRTRAYVQPGTLAPVRMIGTLNDTTAVTPGITIPGPTGPITLPGTTVNSASKSVFNPPSEDIEFTLAVGQSITKTTTDTTTITLPQPFGPTTTTSSATYLYEARESLSVLGRTFDTCRYRTTLANGSSYQAWFAVGKGVMVQTQTPTPAGQQLIQLKSGTYNGAPL